MGGMVYGRGGRRLLPVLWGAYLTCRSSPVQSGALTRERVGGQRLLHKEEVLAGQVSRLVSR
jgi:hypothetical protein